MGSSAHMYRAMHNHFKATIVDIASLGEIFQISESMYIVALYECTKKVLYKYKVEMNILISEALD